MKTFKHYITEEDNPRIPRKKGQPANSKKHSDLYTDENPKGTIHGLGFKDVETARKSVKKIENSGKKHAHKIQAAIAMEQRAREMGKTEEAAVYRQYINKMKKKTKEMNKILNKFEAHNSLIILDKNSKEKVFKSLRNLPNVKTTDINHFSAFDIIKFKKVIFYINLSLRLQLFMSKIDPELKKKLLKETQTPFKGLRRILWIAFSGSAFLGLLIMLSKIASGSELQQNNLFIQLGACIIFPTLLFFDRNED